MTNKKQSVGKVLDDLAAREIPATLNLWPRLRARLVQEPARRLAPGFGPLTAGLMAVIVFLAFMTLRQALPSASAAAPLTSYRGVIASHNIQITQDSRTLIETQQYVWFQAPGYLRDETYRICPDGPLDLHTTETNQLARNVGARATFAGPSGGRCATPITMTLRGPDGRIYIDTHESRLEMTFMEPDSPDLSRIPMPESHRDLKTVKANLEKYNDQVVVLPTTELIAGRPAYVLTMQAKPSKSPENDPLHVTRRTIWLDQQAFFILGEEEIDDKGACIDSWAFTSFEANPTLDPGLFVYLPAQGVGVSFIGLHATWQALEKGASFLVYEPGGTVMSSVYYSYQLTPRRPIYDADKGIVRQEYYSRADPQKRAIALTVLEGKPDAITALVGDVTKDTPISLSSATGYYREQGATRQLVFDRNLTRIALLAQAEISKDDLIQVAASLLPAPSRLTNLPVGTVMVAVPIDSKFDLSGYRTGEVVDVIITFLFVDVDKQYQVLATPKLRTTLQFVTTPAPGATPQTVTRTVISGATFLGTNIVPDQVAAPPPNTMFLAVSSEDATVLEWAIEAKLRITLVRHPADK